MEKELQSGVQDEFINSIRKQKAVITLYLMSGLKLQGRIRSFDKFSIILDINGCDHLIFKHAISTIMAPRGFGSRERVEGEEVAAKVEGAKENAT